MNIHPIFVHFPIALLTLYTVFELLRFKKLNNKTFFYIKTIFLLLGSISLLVALKTGDFGVYLHPEARDIIHIHEFYAHITTAIFGLLSASYSVLLVDEYLKNKTLPLGLQGIWKLILKIREKIFFTPVVVLLALLGLVAITITGALGGYIVYGLGNDFVTDAIVNLIIR